MIRRVRCCISVGLALALYLVAPPAGAVLPDLSDAASARLRPKHPGTWAATQDTIRFLIDAFYLSEAESLSEAHLRRVRNSPVRTESDLWQALVLAAEAKCILPGEMRKRSHALVDTLEAIGMRRRLSLVEQSTILRLRAKALHLDTREGVVPTLEKASHLLEISAGKQHPDYAGTLASRARYARFAGNFARADTMLRDAARVFETINGPQSDSLYDCLDWLATNLQQQDDLAGAYALSTHVLDQQKRNLGASAPRLWLTLYHIAALYYRVGQSAASLRAIDDALRVIGPRIETEMPDAHLLYAMKGDIAQELGQYALAESLLRRASDVETRFGGNRPYWQYAQNSLGIALLNAGRVAEAKDLFHRLRSRFPPAGADDLVSANDWNLASIAMIEGDTTLARGHLQSVRARHESGGFTLGTTERLALLRDQAVLEWLCGNVEQTFEQASQVERETGEYSARLAGGLSESDALALASARVGGVDLALSALLASRDSLRLRRRAFELVIQSRASVLGAMSARAHSWAHPRDPEVGALVESLLAIRAEMPARGRSLGRSRPEANELFVRENELLRQLREKDLGWERVIRNQETDLAAVEAVLPPRSALVSFVRFDRRGEAPGSGRDTRSNIPSYVAFVLCEGDAEPRAVPLGAATRIDSLIERWYRATSLSGSSSVRRALGNELRGLLWDPLRLDEGKRSRIFVVPDGSISLVPIAALPQEDGTPMMLRLPPISYVSAERSLAMDDSPRSPVRVLSLGDADFRNPPARSARMASGKGALVLASAGRETFAASRLRSAVAECHDQSPFDWPRLEYSGAEAHEVSELARESGLECDLYLQAQASERTFRTSSRGRQVLHVASHAFYLPPSCTGKLGAFETILLRCGVAFSGAALGGAGSPSDDDGILTAEEISLLNLSAAECVVLSACETGVGDVIDGEGMIGLRWSVEVAGARSLVTTLWKVDDAATRAWMREFYKGLFGRNEDPATAAHTASRTMYQWAKRAGRAHDVSTWGAFVVSGMGRPLREAAAAR